MTTPSPKDQAKQVPDFQFSGSWPNMTLRIPIGIDGDATKHQLRFIMPEDAKRLLKELQSIVPFNQPTVCDYESGDGSDY